MEQRILALDVGDKRIGVAVSDSLGWTAQPLETYTRVGYGPDTRHLAALAEQYQTRQVLCGLPRNMDGTQGGQAQKVQAFAAELEKAGLHVIFWDERMTTVTAERALIEGHVRREERKKKVDMLAATIILQAYLDAGRPHEQPEQSEGKNMNDDQDNVVELLDEEGQAVRFEHLMTLEHEGKDYVLLTELGDGEGDSEESEGEVYILRIDTDERGEDCYVAVEDEDVLQAVFDKFVVLSGQDELYGEDDEEDEAEEEE